MRKSSGFTLVELMVVIAILLVLAALLLPVFGWVKDRSKDTVCLSNLSQIGKAMALYAGDNNDALPHAPPELAKYQAGSSGGSFFDLPPVGQVLIAYGATTQLLRCPKDVRYIGPDPETGQFVQDSSTSFWSRTGSSYDYVASSPERIRYFGDFPQASDSLLARDAHPFHGNQDSEQGTDGRRFNLVFFDLHTQSLLWADLEEVNPR